jgi:hypothetical protein
LFELYPSVRGKVRRIELTTRICAVDAHARVCVCVKTLFQSKDRLQLTASLLSSFIDTTVLKDNNIILDFLVLHNANEGEVEARPAVDWRDSLGVFAASRSHPKC